MPNDVTPNDIIPNDVMPNYILPNKTFHFAKETNEVLPNNE